MGKKRWVSAREAAGILEVHVNTIYNAIKRGELEAVNAGERLTRVSLASVLALRSRPANAASTPGGGA